MGTPFASIINLTKDIKGKAQESDISNAKSSLVLDLANNNYPIKLVVKNSNNKVLLNKSVNMLELFPKIKEHLGKLFHFVGYVSETEPAGAKKDELWCSELKSEFPFAVKKFNGDAWEDYNYTATDFDVWANLGDNKEYYYLGTTINRIDFTVDPKEFIDDITINLTDDQKHIQAKDKGITKAKLADEVINDYSIDDDNSSLKLDMDNNDYPITLSVKTLDGDEVLSKSIKGKDLLDKALIDNDDSTITLEADETTALKNLYKIVVKNKSGDVILDKSLSLAELELDGGEY